MRESKIESDCRDLAEMMGWVVYKGGGVNGAADKVFLKNGRGFTAEIKTKRGQQSVAQIKHQKYLTKRGVKYYLIRTLEEFKQAILQQEQKQ